jgi:hypothetical protein
MAKRPGGRRVVRPGFRQSWSPAVLESESPAVRRKAAPGTKTMGRAPSWDGGGGGREGIPMAFYGLVMAQL